MAKQLSLFAPVEVEEAAPVAVPAPTRSPRRKAAKLPAGLSAEENGEYYTVRLHEEWIGSIRHLGGKVWNLHFPNERGVCGFGGPNQADAVTKLHELHLAKPQPTPAPQPAEPEPIPYDEGYEEGGYLHLGMRDIALFWSLDALREKVARFTTAMEDGGAGGIQKMREQKLPEQVIARRTANVARLLSIMIEVLAEREAANG